MKFGPRPLNQAVGQILGHNVAGPDGRRLLRKGKSLTEKDIALLEGLGRGAVYVAELEPGDVDENTAARRVAVAIAGAETNLSPPQAGRVNLFSQAQGILRIAFDRLAEMNGCQGLTVAALQDNTVVTSSRLVATVKILPYALPEETVREVESIALAGRRIVVVEPFVERSAGLILSGSPSTQARIVRTFQSSLDRRLEAMKASISRLDYVPLEDASDETRLAAVIQEHVLSGVDIIILAGDTAIMDRYDIAPRAVEKAGGEVICYGAPVDPGNLLMLAYLGPLPVIGAPGCVRSPKANIIDLLLPRLLVGDRLTRADIIHLGHGGLLEDIPERPMPRDSLL